MAEASLGLRGRERRIWRPRLEMLPAAAGSVGWRPPAVVEEAELEMDEGAEVAEEGSLSRRREKRCCGG